MREGMLAFHHGDEIPKEVSFKREIVNLAYMEVSVHGQRASPLWI